MLLALGLNHQSAPVAIREKVAFPVEQLPPALRELTAHHAVEEAAIVSTCNRTEIYCRTEQPEAVQEWLTHYHALEQHHVEPYLYRLEQDRAAAHAFRVASGLDSMVVGEAQILGQMKQAVRAAAAAGTLGWLLHKLFQHTFLVAKQVRTQTEIGANSVSMAAAAVRLATRVFGEVKDLQVLFVGAGEMIELCATHFHAQLPRRMSVTNRTLERAQALAHRFDADAFTLAELPEQIAAYEVIITSTASSLPIIGKGLMERVIKARRHKPVVMVDLAVPRDVEAEVGELPDVYLYTVDDLGSIVTEGQQARQSAVAEAETIISAQVSEFRRWLDSRAAVPMVRQLREFAEQYRRVELERARRMLARGDDPQQVLDALSQGLTNKFLHHPTHALTHAEPNDYPALSQLVNRLFPPHESE